MKRLVPAFLFSLSVLTAACGDSDSNDAAVVADGTLDGTAYIVTDGAALERTDADLSGSGSVLFKNPLSEIGSKDNFLLEFRVDDGGSLELLTHTDNAGKSGVSAIITRDGTALSLAWAAGGETSDKTTLDGIDASGTIKLAIDIHNDETPSHNLVWDGNSTANTEDNALINSEDDIASPGKGSGTFWGLTLSKSTVLSAILQAAKFVEE